MGDDGPRRVCGAGARDSALQLPDRSAAAPFVADIIVAIILITVATMTGILIMMTIILVIAIILSFLLLLFVVLLVFDFYLHSCCPGCY